MNPPDDLPKDLTFTDPIITGRPHNLQRRPEPKPEPPPTPSHKVRDLVIGLILLAAFFGAIWGVSRLILSHR